MTDDLISRQDAIALMCRALHYNYEEGYAVTQMLALPSAYSERLTDKEQRIFLAAMAREERVCKGVDAEMTREPYEDSLVSVCREIERKVKKALWTN